MLGPASEGVHLQDVRDGGVVMTEIGRVGGDARPLVVGVDDGDVSIGSPEEPWYLDAGEQEAFAQLYLAAHWRAAAQRAAMTEDEGAGGRPHSAVEATGGASGGEPAAGTSRGSVSAAGELEALAREMLATFTKTSDGHRARAGQVQIARWTERLERGSRA